MSKVRNSRIALWAHCVSEHAVILPPETTMDDLEDYHDAEHRGPGTIRNHDPSSRTYSLEKLGRVLSEAEPQNPGSASVAKVRSYSVPGAREQYRCASCRRLLPRDETFNEPFTCAPDRYTRCCMQGHQYTHVIVEVMES